MELLSINWGNAFFVFGFGFSVVLVILFLLVLLLSLWEKVPLAVTWAKKQIIKNKKTREMREQILSKPRKKTMVPQLEGQFEIAAIAMALHFYLNQSHDEESNIITIKNIEKRYSPWNSKIHGMNNTIQYLRK